jgi:REP element-mobilizing transposase RayT
MNRFLLDHHPKAIAKQLCDQHIVKMPLEEAQMLCTSLWHHAPEYAAAKNLYKPVHQKHPCTLWAMRSQANYVYAFNLYASMLEEYTYRYGKVHGASKHFMALADGKQFLPVDSINHVTKHPECFSGMDHLKTDAHWPIKSYRNFYIADKARFARYNKGRDIPGWMKGATQ